MPDMLVKLYDLPEDAQTACPRDESVQIRRAMAPDKFRVVEWVKEHSGLSAAGECDVCFARPAVSCFIATRGKKILGYLRPYTRAGRRAGRRHRPGDAAAQPRGHACGGLRLCSHRRRGPAGVLQKVCGRDADPGFRPRHLPGFSRRDERVKKTKRGTACSKAGRSSFAVILCANAFSADGSIQPRRWALRYARSCRIPDNAECPRQRRPPSWR